MILSIVRNWCDAEVEHKLYLSNILEKYFQCTLEFIGPQSVEKLAAYCFIKQVRGLVLSHDRQDFLSSIEIYKEKKSALGANCVKFVEVVEEVFNYNRFIAKGKGWNAYALCRKSKTRICPYCNHAYAFTVQSENGDFRPTLDHFYYKDEYPHLALSLYNLVPSCSSCNSSLKGKADFFSSLHLNPLFDFENIQFYLTASGDPADLVEAIEARRDDVLVKAKAVSLCPMSERSLATFIINERYEMLSVEAVDFYLAKKNYDEAILNIQFDFSFDESTCLRFSREKYSDYILGKMFADIYDSLSH
ncbi:hypothetical protein ACI2KE_16745 [Pseudomonas monteilii]